MTCRCLPRRLRAVDRGGAILDLVDFDRGRFCRQRRATYSTSPSGRARARPTLLRSSNLLLLFCARFDGAAGMVARPRRLHRSGAALRCRCRWWVAQGRLAWRSTYVGAGMMRASSAAGPPGPWLAPGRASPSPGPLDDKGGGTVTGCSAEDSRKVHHGARRLSHDDAIRGCFLAPVRRNLIFSNFCSLRRAL